MDYKYREFKWLSTWDGFNYPVDIFYGDVYLGLIEALAEGYVIRLIDGPHGKIKIKESPNNKFKTKEIAAQVLHKAWKMARNGQL
jgi:hypothetical protein